MSNATNIGGIEVYEHEIYRLADEFISKELNGDEESVHDNFLRMIFYIRDRIEKPSNDDIGLLDGIFDVFLELCVKYKVLPTLECFSFLVKINKATFTDWMNGEYRKSSAHGKTCKKWLDICKSFTIERLHNSERTDVNLIFVSKAAYGLRETSPEPAENSMNGILQLSREQIAERYREFNEVPERLELD